MRVWLGLLFALALGGVAAHAGYDFVAAPDGDDNGECTFRSRPSACSVLKGHQREQQPQGLRKANQGKTDSYCLDRRHVIPQAEFSGPFRDQNVKTPERKSDHRDAAESDHIGEDSSLHGQLLPLPPP